METQACRGSVLDAVLISECFWHEGWTFKLTWRISILEILAICSLVEKRTGMLSRCVASRAIRTFARSVVFKRYLIEFIIGPASQIG